ncbi:hypothetical protein ACFR99_11435 [Haloarchaeobius amylolyticus]|uniref:Uncharacterized protein n=1 Tax=Haloarchaeobius amylolyticus TaxID=1198296 RepID=A0ABD6BHX0_9EURY
MTADCCPCWRAATAIRATDCHCTPDHVADLLALMKARWLAGWCQ